MNKYFIAALTVGAMTAAGVGLAALAGAAPAGPSVTDTVAKLEADGYHVILSRSGSAPMSSCSITSVRPGHSYVTVDSRGGSSLTETILFKTMRVDLAC